MPGLSPGSFTERLPVPIHTVEGGGRFTGKFKCWACHQQHNDLPIDDLKMAVICPVKRWLVPVTDNSKAVK